MQKRNGKRDGSLNPPFTKPDSKKPDSKNPDKKERLAQARRRVERAERWRLAFLMIVLLFLLFLYFGGKAAAGAPWFEAARRTIYWITGWDLIAVLVSTLVQLRFTYQYNHILKED